MSMPMSKRTKLNGCINDTIKCHKNKLEVIEQLMASEWDRMPRSINNNQGDLSCVLQLPLHTAQTLIFLCKHICNNSNQLTIYLLFFLSLFFVTISTTSRCRCLLTALFYDCGNWPCGKCERALFQVLAASYNFLL